MKNKRVLWLLNHTTLRDFEVPLLVDFGFEVFVPKVFPADEANRSASVTYEYDTTLTISKDNLEILNSFDFYIKDFTTTIADIINNEFDIAICAFFPLMLKTLMSKFKGNVFLRVFGLAGDTEYENILNEIDSQTLQKIYKNSNRFFFAQSYPEISLNEHGIFKKNNLTLPLGMPKSFYINQNTWKGDEKKILFICPRITSSPTYYGNIYRNFKRYFGDLEHVIGGAQPTEVDDPVVLGFQPREVLDNLLQNCRVMFYHSREPRHLHYHPLEAIIYGMPLIYMSGGLLESLGGSDQPGMCYTEEEARNKIEKILSGDSALIETICLSQKKILENFSYNYCKKIWENNFLPVVSEIKSNLNKSKIAIFLPVAYHGGSLQGAKNIAKMISIGSKNDNESVEVIFSCLKDTYDIEYDFADLVEIGIEVRETEWKVIDRDETNIALEYMRNTKKLKHNAYLLPTDGIKNFIDCDFWLIISDRTFTPLAPLVPYGMVIYDYIQRYIPNIFNEDNGALDLPFIYSTRDAEMILCTTPQTREDTIQYAGISDSKVILTPMEFNPLKKKPHLFFDEPIEYFIWTSNSTQHKNHLNALNALEYYYEALDGKLKVVLTGVETEFFQKDNIDEHPYRVNIRNLIQRSTVLRNNILILGNLSEQQYVSVLSEAKYLFHPALYDNGTFSVIEAAYHSVPSISSNYPQMQYINQRFSLGLEFFDPRKPKDIAEKLKYAEENSELMKNKLPRKMDLESFSYENLADKYWTIIKDYL
jgi:glycosyltransferase involved in cell wall biosynthesis